jgi:intein-encoded DNA endonuclease-like protein
VKPDWNTIERFQGQYRGKISKMFDEVAAYTAGFLDGDGSIMAQLVYRKDYRLGYQIRVSIVFYQKQSHNEILFWLKEQLVFGYIRDRNDGMTEYTIVGLEEVAQVLNLLLPNLRLKKRLAEDVMKLIALHPKKMTATKLIKLAKLVDKTAEFNYSKKRTNTSEVVIQFLKDRQLFPVETSC